MKYISIGVVMAPSTEHILKVSHYGTEFTLTGDLARLWLDGRYGFANSETPIEHKALSQLKRMCLVITTNPYKVGEYRALTQSMIVPTEKKGPDFCLNAEEKNIPVWLREAGLRLTMANWFTCVNGKFLLHWICWELKTVSGWLSAFITLTTFSIICWKTRWNFPSCARKPSV